jgi:hypothetical protein
MTNFTKSIVIAGISLCLSFLGVVMGYSIGFDHGFEKAAKITREITSFDECVAAGYAILESYPERCRTNSGETFVRPILKEEVNVFCTQDAKLCPDGSYVGRQAPACEFSPCPGS